MSDQWSLLFLLFGWGFNIPKEPYKDGFNRRVHSLIIIKNGQLSAERRLKKENQVGRYTKTTIKDGRIEEEGIWMKWKTDAILTRMIGMG